MGIWGEVTPKIFVQYSWAKIRHIKLLNEHGYTLFDHSMESYAIRYGLA